MRPLVKVCGMTRAGDVGLSESLGADFLGFIFHPGSPRCVEPDFVRSIKPEGARKVGVFVKQSASEVIGIMQDAGLQMAQLHGGQNEEFCQAVGARKVIKVLWPQRHETVAGLQADIDRFAPHCAYLLFDAGKSGGGHGTALDFDIFNKIDIPCPWLLAGGLGPENIRQALDQARPSGLDLNSGVESAPGIKDRHKLETVFDIINDE